MSYLLNDPAHFREEMIRGFVAAHPDVVRPVDGGVVRSSDTPAGQVALVIGGGSGHYPAFAGLVGPGLAHGAAMGDVFASPSAHQVYSVARAAAAGGGVVLSYGNYTGDCLNFDQAEARLVAEGIPCRTVVVTDDIASAAEPEAHRRRGIAGDLVVFRAAGWAASQGRSLDEVWELGIRANRRTRTLGVAFSGCTLPGADHPLFTVPAGMMSVGLGVHGEPGLSADVPLPSAADLAHTLVEEVLRSRPADLAPGETRVAVILNGLGSVKSEELFLTYGFVADDLAKAGLSIVAPEVGEMVTSFEMAGVSLTVAWLDDELETAWLSPAATAAFRRGVVEAGPARAPAQFPIAERAGSWAAATPESRSAAVEVVSAMLAIRDVIDQNVDELGRIDAVAGDGDHGIGLQRGATAGHAAAVEAAGAGAGARSTLTAAADAWADRAGGSSGALWGLALRAVSGLFTDDAAPDRQAVASGVRAARDAIAAAGKAQLGDKTMLDALIPFAEDLQQRVDSGESLADAWRSAARTATSAAAATADLRPRIGRARSHPERSIGVPDPGAVSLALAVTAVGDSLTGTGGRDR